MERKLIKLPQKPTIDITTRLKGKYGHLGGFTIGGVGGVLFAFAARKATDFGRVFTIPIIGGGSFNQSAEIDIKHGNDLAYYDYAYYLALGNGGQHNTETHIRRFSSDLKTTSLFDFISQEGSLNGKDQLNYISKICHYKDNKFIVGSGLQLALCSLDSDSHQFNEIGRFNLFGFNSPQLCCVTN